MRAHGRGDGLHDAADYCALTQHVVIVLTPLAGKARGRGARERINRSMSAPVPLGYAESGDAAEREKDQTQNKVTPTPGEACAEERQRGEQSKVSRRLGVRFPGPRKHRPAASQHADR
jgi:hypothetical protein